MTQSWMDYYGDVAVDYACGWMSGALFGDWEAFDVAANALCGLAAALCPAAIAASSGADTEEDYYR